MIYDATAFGKVIRKLRTDKGMSQEVLSGFAGIARSHLAMIENGKKEANVETLWKIATASGLRLSELVEMAERLMPE